MSLQLVEELLAAAAGVFMDEETGVSPADRHILKLAKFLCGLVRQLRGHNVPGSGQGPERHQADSQ